MKTAAALVAVALLAACGGDESEPRPVPTQRDVASLYHFVGYSIACDDTDWQLSLPEGSSMVYVRECYWSCASVDGIDSLWVGITWRRSSAVGPWKAEVYNVPGVCPMP